MQRAERTHGVSPPPTVSQEQLCLTGLDARSVVQPARKRPTVRRSCSDGSSIRLQLTLFAKRSAPSGMKDAGVLAGRKPHGTRIRYVAGCRCLPCRAANSNYEHQRADRRKAGAGNQLVPAGRARAHLSTLSHNHIGRRSVARLSGVSAGVLWSIRAGRRRRIRKQTERRILQVTVRLAQANTLVKAGPTWKRIDRLLHEGFSKGELARRLGFSRLRMGKFWTTAERAGRVAKFYKQIME